MGLVIGTPAASTGGSGLVTCDGDNRLLVVLFTSGGNSPSFTYDGDPLAQHFNISAQVTRAKGFYIINPAAGENLLVCVGGSGKFGWSAIPFSGADQDVGVRVASTNNDGGGYPNKKVEVLVGTTLADDIVVFSGCNSTAGIINPYGGQTQTLAIRGGGEPYQQYHGYKTAVGDTTWMGYNMNVYEWRACGGFAVIPSSGIEVGLDTVELALSVPSLSVVLGAPPATSFPVTKDLIGSRIPNIKVSKDRTEI